MSDREDPVLEGLYQLIAEEWRQLQALRKATAETLDRLRDLLSQALAMDASGRRIHRRTGVPETTVRRLTVRRMNRKVGSREADAA